MSRHDHIDILAKIKKGKVHDMKSVYSVLAAMANDKRISDANFRAAVRELFDPDRQGGASFVDRVRCLAQNAIYETERERYVR